jgi:hypothetical protein
MSDVPPAARTPTLPQKGEASPATCNHTIETLSALLEKYNAAVERWRERGMGRDEARAEAADVFIQNFEAGSEAKPKCNQCLKFIAEHPSHAGTLEAVTRGIAEMRAEIRAEMRVVQRNKCSSSVIVTRAQNVKNLVEKGQWKERQNSILRETPLSPDCTAIHEGLRGGPRTRGCVRGCNSEGVRGGFAEFHAHRSAVARHACNPNDR